MWPNYTWKLLQSTESHWELNDTTIKISKCEGNCKNLLLLTLGTCINIWDSIHAYSIFQVTSKNCIKMWSYWGYFTGNQGKL